ncbi:mediator of RNA polymerase II transcription subunit 6 [Toxorhynchites rutilus septentrionalis]|uniref:mediator of RNA polymerase II transcription subunit 6 n=1 Tax=Toxorhynchites rutilus septentrionalis TaxID=329112 RepID=UPI00247887C6|nr:mediator of RNA polymerase II transcription subunit 6 [Toxorhynchites rutilus septentrionalis]
MMPGRLGLPIAQENPLWISWHDSNWIPILNPTNVMDYFSEKSNPFYDRTCNNEIVRMQRQNLDLLNNMTGVEYILLHVQDPILYVIRKQHRHSPSEATPLADYYIIAGTVYQAPDLGSVFNSRILSAVHHLQSAFEEASSYSRYHPSKGYSWDFSSNKAIAEKNKTAKNKETPVREEPSSLFQRQRVDMLLGDLLRKFPLPVPQTSHQLSQNGSNNTNNGGEGILDHGADAINIKQEPSEHGSNNTSEMQIKGRSDMKPPPEKKIKI